jgi:hypothetical protein
MIELGVNLTESAELRERAEGLEQAEQERVQQGKQP